MIPRHAPRPPLPACPLSHRPHPGPHPIRRPAPSRGAGAASPAPRSGAEGRQASLAAGDRLLLAALSRLLRRSSLDALLPRPETLLRWHRELVCMEVAVGGRSLTARSSPVGDPFAPDEFAVPAQQGVGVGQER